MKKYALFRPHFYKPISALACYIYDIDKILCMNDESDISKQGCTPSQFFFFLGNCCAVCDSLVSEDMDI